MPCMYGIYGLFTVIYLHLVDGYFSKCREIYNIPGSYEIQTFMAWFRTKKEHMSEGRKANWKMMHLSWTSRFLGHLILG